MSGFWGADGFGVGGGGVVPGEAPGSGAVVPGGPGAVVRSGAGVPPVGGSVRSSPPESGVLLVPGVGSPRGGHRSGAGERTRVAVVMGDVCVVSLFGGAVLRILTIPLLVLAGVRDGARGSGGRSGGGCSGCAPARRQGERADDGDGGGCHRDGGRAMSPPGRPGSVTEGGEKGGCTAAAADRLLRGVRGTYNGRSAERHCCSPLCGYLCAQLGDGLSTSLVRPVEKEYRQGDGPQDSGQYNICHGCPQDTDL